MTGFVVDTATMREHAAAVDELASSVAQCAAAAGTVHLDGGAFGVMCQFLPPLVRQNQTATTAAVSAMQGTLSAVAEAVRAMADDYDAHDTAAADRMGALLTQLTS